MRKLFEEIPFIRSVSDKNQLPICWPNLNCKSSHQCSDTLMSTYSVQIACSKSLMTSRAISGSRCPGRGVPMRDPTSPRLGRRLHFC